MMVVTKRDGRTEPFSERKLRQSIEKAALDAGCSRERRELLVEQVVREVLHAVEHRYHIHTSDLRDRILQTLERLGVGVARAWKRFEKKYKKGKDSPDMRIITRRVMMAA